MIKNIYGKHTFYFSIFTILLSILALFIKSKFEITNEFIIAPVCLFFILSIGISHGAMDNFKANKLLNIYKTSNKFVFYFIYILISIFVIFIWSLFPEYTLISFLIIASYHFGREDTSFLSDLNSYFDQFLYLVKGSIVVFSPLFFHFEETLKIFEILFIKENFLILLKEEHWIINVFLTFSILGYICFVIRNKFVDFEIIFLDLLSILILNYAFDPLFAFTIYFCFLHSIRHIISISNDLDSNNFQSGIKIFIKKALPLTIATIVLYIFAIIFLSFSYGLNEVIVKVIFIGLASLTFPHILLEYLLEINEKRN
tara:strand:+ start:65 stop:1006 length:942 start_codon:yes stop_codon:yes gene_type:complete